jgi:hypothetical protein
LFTALLISIAISICHFDANAQDQPCASRSD